MKAFEAAARHCNFQLAAQELGISASAVSHQVKSLEDFTATPLFIRRNNRLILRDEGKAYYEQLGTALDSIGFATENLIRSSGRGQITVNLYPSLADVWLVPRLGDFHEKHPTIAVRLNTSELVGNSLDREADFALVYSPRTEVPSGATVLFSDDIVPAVAPNYLAQNGPVERPEDLLDHPLIASLSEDEEWKNWFQAQGINEIMQVRQIEMDMCSSCLKAAKEGLGFVMGRRPYLDDDLKSGKLVVPLENKMSTGYCLSLVTTLRGQDLPFGARFRDWIIEASRESEAVWDKVA
ncbi:LysR substrate-binding domain-containing protein [Nitratireductor sp. XY-223]|uniref:LysR substrate-binding domain-containing protein n=1 Tax=Nitratireductor sp. XY-223 TaxID=2561926 RepID=UPI00145A4190|nr:LysR substrate-binding domain-containing protein [Nitratireductor sp. XY-223]